MILKISKKVMSKNNMEMYMAGLLARCIIMVKLFLIRVKINLFYYKIMFRVFNQTHVFGRTLYRYEEMI